MTTAQHLASQAKRARDATARRDQLIRQMRDEGSTLRSIAETCGLTHTAIAKILAREVGPQRLNGDAGDVVE